MKPETVAAPNTTTRKHFPNLQLLNYPIDKVEPVLDKAVEEQAVIKEAYETETGAFIP
jgi:hypothetical protein